VAIAEKGLFVMNYSFQSLNSVEKSVPFNPFEKAVPFLIEEAVLIQLGRK
jgi:hypothetical protein